MGTGGECCELVRSSVSCWSEIRYLGVDCCAEIKRAPPIAADPRRNPGFSDFLIFRKMWISGIFRWDLESGRVCKGLEMAVGFKWTASQLISSLLSLVPSIFMISVILLSFPGV